MDRPSNPAGGKRTPGKDFIRQIVEQHLKEGRYGGRVVTRFPPEPNGYLHVGHATHICLNFGIAQEFGGRCHLRYDDTNPAKEDEEFVRSIQRDVRWLGFDWGEHLYYASDYFERMYESAVILIRKGLAYVDSQTTDAIREGRGTVTEPGVSSPYRDRTVEENLDLFRRMRAGEFEDGAHVLRGKIDMASPNMLMRDPVFYRIRHSHHFRQGDEWCIYPLYDYAHCLEDAFEDVTHSICTLEFENNRELYDWVLDQVGFREPRTHQYEWAGLDLEGAVLSKRLIKPLVQAGLVSGWDDPRLATIAAYRRRGVPPEALRLLAELVGVSRAPAKTEEAKLDFAIREVLNPIAPRVMAVLEPLKVVITNYPGGGSEEIDAPYFPRDVPREGSRPLPFSGELWIERSDFEERPPQGFRRLVPGGEVRLRHAYVIRCDDVVKDATGAVVELRCSYDPATRSGGEGRTAGNKAIGKTTGTIHWVDARSALKIEVRLFGHLFAGGSQPEIDENGVLINAHVNPDSLTVLHGAWIEPPVAHDPADTRYQFERTGYFWRDPVDSKPDALVFNRIVTLRDTWSKQTEAGSLESPASARATPAARERRPAERKAQLAPRVSEIREDARRSDPELAARMSRYREKLGLTQEEADILTGSRALSDFFEDALRVHSVAGDVAAWVVNELPRAAGDTSVEALKLGGRELGRLVALVSGGKLARLAAKDVLAEMVATGADLDEIVRRRGLDRVEADDTLLPLVEGVLAEWPDKVREYRDGKTGLLGFFVGQVVRRTEGRGDPVRVKALLVERLESADGARR